jgi:hypothetical protein
MSNQKKPNFIKKDDYCRVLVTETLPYETPIIFSNDGLYEKLANLDKYDVVQQELIRAIVFGAPGAKAIHSCIPFFYKIRKDSVEFRRLGLMHPHSQWKIKEFYEKYEDLILYHCSQSKATIRSPEKIAGSFFFKNSAENLNQYKAGKVSLLSLEETTKHSPSFFSYRGFDRLYKFFESRDYCSLEKKYSYLLTLDVAKCFDSIYTHTMSWAVKDKEFTKKNVNNKASFAQAFDTVMQHANHSETNGLIIGPEVSRVFAEILFQEIDNRAIERLSDNFKYYFGEQYSFRRYVDDVYIFTKSESVARTVYKSYADILSSFNLHANTSKSIGTSRPFVTNKSRLIHAAKIEIDAFIDKFLESNDTTYILVPKPIRSRWKLTRSFLDSVKALCAYNNVGYDEISGFLIAVITERVKKIVGIDTAPDPSISIKRYKDAILVLLDVLYYFYSVSPSVGASYKLCTSIILCVKFSKKYVNDIEQTIAHAIYELTQLLLSEHDMSNPDHVEGFTPLEILNVILATRELGDNYLIPEEKVAPFFSDGSKFSYFGIVSCLFYIGNVDGYENLRKSVLSAANEKLSNLSDIRMNSEKAHLLLDLLTCPFIADNQKTIWIKAAYTALSLTKPTKLAISHFLHEVSDSHIQINWKEVDLLSALEKKELKQAY